MEISGTKDAFAHMISHRSVYRKLGVSRSTVSSWKIRLRKGNELSLDKMEEMLLKYGAEVVEEKVWDFEE